MARLPDILLARYMVCPWWLCFTFDNPRLGRRARRHGLADRITTSLAGAASLGLTAEADFVLAFWMVHETPDQRTFFGEVRGLMKPGAALLVVEPGMHVPRQAFAATMRAAADAGLVESGHPAIALSRAALLTRGT